MKKLIITTNTTIMLLSALCFLTLSLFTGCQEPAERVEEEPVAEILQDKGKQPWLFDIEEATVENANYRLAVWSGEYMQVVLMSLKPGEIIDLEVHHDHDQFIRVEQGEARILMGETEDDLPFDKIAKDDWAVLIPAGYWHKVENIGDVDLKLYTIYAPPEHAEGILHETYEEAEEYHHHHEH